MGRSSSVRKRRTEQDREFQGNPIVVPVSLTVPVFVLGPPVIPDRYFRLTPFLESNPSGQVETGSRRYVANTLVDVQGLGEVWRDSNIPIGPKYL